MNEQKFLLEIKNLQHKIQDMLVVIDTLQTNIRSVTSYLTDDQKDQITTPSYNWCVNWKPEQD